MGKHKILRTFIDKETTDIRHEGDYAEFTDERAEELAKAGYIVKPKKKRAKKEAKDGK